MENHERNIFFIVMLAMGLWGCGGGGDDGGEASGFFESAGDFDGDGFGADPYGSPAVGGAAGVGGSAAGDPAPNAGDRGEVRDVEEADIYRFEGDRLYVLNTYRGLFVLDVSDPDAPVELGRADLFGEPVEMYVRGDRVFAILRDYLEPYESESLPDDSLRRVSSSRIVALDLSDPRDPASLGEVALDGTIIDSRLVGDVIYAAAAVADEGFDPFPYDGCSDGVSVGGAAGAIAVGGGGAPAPAPVGTPAGPIYGPEQRMVVTAIDVSNPAEPREASQLEIDAGGRFVHATDQAFVIAGIDYGSVDGPQTRVSYVDISDPTGEMALRGSLTLSGEIQDDTALHMHEQQLRVLTRDWSRGLTKVRIFDAADPDALPMLGELDYFYQGDVFGTTFDGDRLYMIHYFTIDPLEVVDLSNPAEPYVAGILEMPGWVDRIAALGDRLIGLGIDDSGDDQLVSVSLFDVADPTSPVLLDRVSTGSGWSSTLASSERKAWSVDADAGMIVFPYSSWDDWGWGQSHAIAFLEFDDQSLTARGEVAAPAEVERGLYRDDHVYALSQAALQVVDLTDRDAPKHTATVELAPSVVGYARVGDVAVELTTLADDDHGTTLRVGGKAVELARPADRVFAADGFALALRTWDDCDDFDDFDGSTLPPLPGGGERPPCLKAGISVVTVGDEPEVVADLDLPELDVPDELPPEAWSDSSWREGYGPWSGHGEGGEAVLRFGGGKLGLIRTQHVECESVAACQALGIEPEYVEEGSADGPPDCVFAEDCDPDIVYSDYAYGSRQSAALHVLDLAHPDGPRFVAEHALEPGAEEHAFARDGMLVYSHARHSRTDDEGREYVRFFLERARIGDDGELEELPSVNVPGVVLALRDDGVAVTGEPVWVEGRWDDYEIGMRLNTIRIDGDKASRLARRDLGQNVSGFALNESALYLLREVEAQRENADGETCQETRQVLRAISLADPDSLEDSHDLDLGASYWDLAGLTNERLVLMGGPIDGIAVFDLSDDALSPALRRYTATEDWGGGGVMGDDAFYLPVGRHGVQRVGF